MDLRTEEEIGETPKTENLDSKLKGMGSISEKDMLGNSKGSVSTKGMFFRADKIDLTSLDVQLEKHLSRVWSRNVEPDNRPKEVWEVDLAKLDIRYLVARGTYSTVYRGTYDGQDVAAFMFLMKLKDLCTIHCVLSQTVNDTRVLLGGGWPEMVMEKAVDELARKTPGKKSHAIDAFSRALLAIPTTISDNAGLDSAELKAQLRAEHHKESRNARIDVISGSVGDMGELGISEAFKVKQVVLVSATEDDS